MGTSRSTRKRRSSAFREGFDERRFRWSRGHGEGHGSTWMSRLDADQYWSASSLLIHVLPCPSPCPLDHLKRRSSKPSLKADDLLFLVLLDVPMIVKMLIATCSTVCHFTWPHQHDAKHVSLINWSCPPRTMWAQLLLGYGLHWMSFLLWLYSITMLYTCFCSMNKVKLTITTTALVIKHQIDVIKLGELHLIAIIYRWVLFRTPFSNQRTGTPGGALSIKLQGCGLAGLHFCSKCQHWCPPPTLGTVPVIGLYEVKVGKLYEALNKNF